MSDEQTESEAADRGKPSSPAQLIVAVLAGLGVVIGLYLAFSPSQEELERQFAEEMAAAQARETMAAEEVVEPRSIEPSTFTNLWRHEYVLWWDDVPAGFLQHAISTGTNSNLRHADYIGSDSCRDCHRANHDA